jgi:hypothetical protein
MRLYDVPAHRQAQASPSHALGDVVFHAVESIKDRF